MLFHKGLLGRVGDCQLRSDDLHPLDVDPLVVQEVGVMNGIADVLCFVEHISEGEAAPETTFYDKKEEREIDYSY
jgi:hypothetical protein